MKFFKNNQIIIYVIALMLVTAGYLNYNTNNSNTIETSSNVRSNTSEIADIGDATLVSSNDVIEDEEETNTANNNENIPSSEEIVQANSNDCNPSDEYFSKSKLERENMYSQTIETYQKMLENANVSDEQKKIATQEISKKNAEKNSIMICENLMKTKGFENCVIFVNDKSISVVVDAEKLQQEDIAQIQNIVSREMDADVDNIHITNK